MAHSQAELSEEDPEFHQLEEAEAKLRQLVNLKGSTKARARLVTILDKMMGWKLIDEM